MAGGDVAHVDDVECAVDVDGDPAEQEAAHEPHRGPGRVVRAENERRVDDHHGQPLGGVSEGLELGLVLGVDVGEAEMPDLEGRRLVGGAARLRDPDRAHGRGVDQALDPGGERLLEHEPGAPQVGGEDRVAVGGAQRGPAGDVEHARDALHRPAHGAPVGDVAHGALELEPGERLEVGAAPDEQPQVVAALGQRARDVRAEEPGGPGDQRLRHAGGS